MHKEGASCEDKGRYPGDRSTSKAMKDIARKPPQARREA